MKTIRLMLYLILACGITGLFMTSVYSYWIIKHLVETKRLVKRIKP